MTNFCKLCYIKLLFFLQFFFVLPSLLFNLSVNPKNHKTKQCKQINSYIKLLNNILNITSYIHKSTYTCFIVNFITIFFLLYMLKLISSHGVKQMTWNIRMDSQSSPFVYCINNVYKYL